MTQTTIAGQSRFFSSIVFKNILLFLLILLVAVVPLAFRYYQDSRDYEIKVLASQLEFFAERGASWLDPRAIDTLRSVSDQQTDAYHDTFEALSRIENEFAIDNAVLMRRKSNGIFEYVAVGANAYRGGSESSPSRANPCSPAARSNPCSPTGNRSIFNIGQPVHIHNWFPATYQSTEDTWQAGQMMHSRLFGGQVGSQHFDPFLQINAPLKVGEKVVAILMLNKFARPVAEQVQANTVRLFGITAGILAMGLMIFGWLSSRMLRMLKNLTWAAEEVSRGNLGVTIEKKPSNDEVGRLTVAFENMLGGLRQRDFIRDTFGRYLSQEVVEEVLNSPGGLKLGGELREVSFLVSDLRGFTAQSSRMAPEQVIQVVNRFLEPMVEIITRFRGTVDAFQGDGILAFFGAPLSFPDDAERAVACAVEMQRALIEINTEHKIRGLPEFRMGIGINTGDAVVGNIGSMKRTQYTALGTPLNITYRIESFTVGGQVLISESTYERVKEIARVENLSPLRFKGVEKPIQVYEVRGLTGNYPCEMPQEAPENFIDLDPPLALECFILEGKTVSENGIAGRIERLAENSAEVVLNGAVEVNTNLRVELTAQDARILEAYARVVQSNPANRNGGTQVVLNFTSLPDEAKSFLETKRKSSLKGRSPSN